MAHSCDCPPPEARVFSSVSPMQAVGGLCPWQKSCGVEWRLLPEHMFPSQKLGPPRVLGGFSGEDWVRMDPVCSRGLLLLQVVGRY
jgi:hypothetical protein